MKLASKLLAIRERLGHKLGVLNMRVYLNSIELLVNNLAPVVRSLSSERKMVLEIEETTDAWVVSLPRSSVGDEGAIAQSGVWQLRDRQSGAFIDCACHLIRLGEQQLTWEVFLRRK
jgi:hypothetical protein